VKILVDENMPYARELFSRLGEVRRSPVARPVDALTDADALMVRSVTKVNEALLAGKAINSSAPRRQVPIMSIRRGCSRPELVFPPRRAATRLRWWNMFSPRC
jgi:hypothetical protein